MREKLAIEDRKSSLTPRERASGRNRDLQERVDAMFKEVKIINKKVTIKGRTFMHKVTVIRTAPAMGGDIFAELKKQVEL